MKTYTPTVARQHLFTLLKQTNESNTAIQITCSSKKHLNNENYYVLSQQQYDDYVNDKKIVHHIVMQKKLHSLVKKIVKNHKPMNEAEFKKDFHA